MFDLSISYIDISFRDIESVVPLSAELLTFSFLCRWCLNVIGKDV